MKRTPQSRQHVCTSNLQRVKYHAIKGHGRLKINSRITNTHASYHRLRVEIVIQNKIGQQGNNHVTFKSYVKLVFLIFFVLRIFLESNKLF